MQDEVDNGDLGFVIPESPAPKESATKDLSPQISLHAFAGTRASKPYASQAP